VRRRVALGFGCAAAALALARPTATSLAIGTLVASLGQSLRVWAAGHLEKGREVTASGPYRFSRHPLYVGSTIMGAGLAIASRSVLVAAIVAVYFAATLTAAIRNEETFLRQRFGDDYDAYASGIAIDDKRLFSVGRLVRNREHRAIAGFVVVVGLLALKTFW
jgi:protein-S-isoprenylcysteine O-methyltransferase Ste14